MSEDGLAHYSPAFCFLKQVEAGAICCPRCPIAILFWDTVPGQVVLPCELRKRGASVGGDGCRWVSCPVPSLNRAGACSTGIRCRCTVTCPAVWHWIGWTRWITRRKRHEVDQTVEVALAALRTARANVSGASTGTKWPTPATVPLRRRRRTRRGGRTIRWGTAGLSRARGTWSRRSVALPVQE